MGLAKGISEVLKCSIGLLHRQRPEERVRYCHNVILMRLTCHDYRTRRVRLTVSPKMQHLYPQRKLLLAGGDEAMVACRRGRARC